MRLEVTPSFISVSECAFLNSWVHEGVDKKWLDRGLDAKGFFVNERLTSRLYGERYTFPEEVIALSNRIRAFVGIDKYPLIHNNGKNGVVVSFTKPGGDVHKHKDPRWNGMSALRCNIMTQEAEENAELFVNGKKVNIKAGDLHCYLASDFEHYVTKVKGNTPRILWMFGAYVPKTDWESGKIKYGSS